jgi:DnaJ-class molecular chaperone
LEETVMSPSTFVSRRESLDRWTAALKRATDKGVKIYRIESTSQFIATSGTTVTTGYATDGVECECMAAVHGDPVCQHRAAYWAAQGMLTLDDAAPATRPCGACGGSGECWRDGQFTPDPCFYCRGAGAVDVVTDQRSRQHRPVLAYRFVAARRLTNC